MFVPRWLEKKKAKKICLLTNEFKDLEEKKKAVNRIGGLIGTQLTKEDGERLYGQAVMSCPHALNPDAYCPVVPRRSRPYDVGFRGNPYGAKSKDTDRADMVELFKTLPLKSDIDISKTGFITERWMWASFLNSIRAIPTTEAGMVGAKIMSPRHMDAVGTHTLQVSYPGKYSGVLKPHQYLTLYRDHSNLMEVIAALKDEGYCSKIVVRGREEILEEHTYAHRVKALREELSRGMAS